MSAFAMLFAAVVPVATLLAADEPAEEKGVAFNWTVDSGSPAVEGADVLEVGADEALELGEDLVVDGLRVDGDLVVDGHLTVHVRGDLIAAEGGRIVIDHDDSLTLVVDGAVAWHSGFDTETKAVFTAGMLLPERDRGALMGGMITSLTDADWANVQFSGSGFRGADIRFDWADKAVHVVRMDDAIEAPVQIRVE